MCSIPALAFPFGHYQQWGIEHGGTARHTLNATIFYVHTYSEALADMCCAQLSDEGADDCLIYGLSAMQGWRISMEDAHAAVLDLQPEENGKKPSPAGPDKRMAYFGVYDGHGGEKVAQFAGENIHKIIAKQEGFLKGDIEKAMKDGFLATDRAILSGKNKRE
jgi:protein phosphatase 2C family protein 2/3